LQTSDIRKICEVPGPFLASTSPSAEGASTLHDEEPLRLLVRELQTSLWSAVEASDWNEQEERMVAARDPMNRMQERVHLLLNKLF
jgi:hypothetical protein